MSTNGQLYRLVYRSRVSPDIRDRVQEETARILKTARERNADLNVSGALLANDDHFVQILEGQEADVEAVFELISGDPRHRDVTLIEFAPIPKRDFGQWQMARLSGELRREDLGALMQPDAEAGEIVELFAQRLGVPG